VTALPDDTSTGSMTPSERLLHTRIAELEAEVAELREAAAQARSLVVRAGAERIGLQAERDDLHDRLRQLTTLRGSLHGLRDALARRVRQ
jgi:chromosome segregation ATPase